MCPAWSTWRCGAAGSGIPIRADGSEGDPITISALPPDSGMVEPTLQEGRWLMPDDENAIVISQKVLANEPDLRSATRSR